ncbi:hypothetical protein ABW20_dc0101144 [Dactylellina cionopaga]|nr:hypothetical protein ABW20_dc0101144 [Dactylellina cionopaga]
MSTPQPTSSTKESRRKSIQRFVSKLIKPGAKPSKKPVPTAETAAAESSTTSAPVPVASTSAAAATPAAPTSAPPPPPTDDAVITPTPIAAAVVTEAAAPTEPESESKPIAEASTTAKPVTAQPAALSAGARQLAEKHGIEIPEDWPYAVRPPVGERVEKPIRMRVRRYCHICQTAFGSDKSCPSCAHKRCVECPRSPLAKTDKKKTKPKHKEFDPYDGLTLPGKPGGQDLVYRKIRQRVHYKCHKCEADFAGQKTCPSCSHNRCKKCHREPSRKPKPIEEIRRKRPIKWTCSECHHPSNATRACTKCNHPRCVDCVREIPKRKKKKAVIRPGVTSAVGTKQDVAGDSSDIDKVSSALAATSIS